MDDKKAKRHPHVVNVEEPEWMSRPHGERFGGRGKRLGPAAGGVKLGCSFYEIPPGKTAFPFHYHLANEEAAYILSGSGTLRIGEETVPIGEGDYIAFPPSPDLAHQIINTGSTVLTYLALATALEPEICGYPDSKKLVLFAGTWEKPVLRKIMRDPEPVDYWDGEKG